MITLHPAGIPLRPASASAIIAQPPRSVRPTPGVSYATDRIPAERGGLYMKMRRGGCSPTSWVRPDEPLPAPPHPSQGAT